MRYYFANVKLKQNKMDFSLDNLRVAEESDFFSTHSSFDDFYFPHLGMNFTIFDGIKHHHLKVHKHFRLDDIAYELAMKKVYVNDEEVQYYKKRMRMFAIHLAKKNVKRYGYSYFS